MTRVLFVCHGNICRSPMAEFVLRDMAARRGMADDVTVASAATSSEEIGNPVYPPVRRMLASHGINCAGKTARRIAPADYDAFDLIIGMDGANRRNMMSLFHGDPEGKVLLLLDLTDHSRAVADPWYTGDFDATWADVNEGCAKLLDLIKNAQIGR